MTVGLDSHPSSCEPVVRASTSILHFHASSRSASGPNPDEGKAFRMPVAMRSRTTGRALIIARIPVCTPASAPAAP